jgi:hypothetical protein
MKNLIIFISLAMTSYAAHAEWKSYAKNAEVEEFFDSAFISKDSGKIKLWTLSNYTAPLTTLEGKEILSEKSLTTLDCSTQKIGAEKIIKYEKKLAQGLVVSEMETALRLSSIRSGSADQILKEKLCN